MSSFLLASRYTDADYSGGNPVETFDPDDIADLGMRWALPFGLQRAELTVKAKSRTDANNRFRSNHGHRIAIYDNWCDRYIGGQVYEIQQDGRFITYILGGPGKRTFDSLYTIGDMSSLDYTSTSADETDDGIKDILTVDVSIANSDQSNIDGSGVALVGWVPDEIIGTAAGDGIRQLAAVGDSSNNFMDFYFVDGTFAGVTLVKPYAYLKSRSLTAGVTWSFDSDDLASGGRTLARHIWQLVRSVTILYGRLTGTHDGLNNLATLTDTGADFRASGVAAGDTVVNQTQDKIFKVASVTTTVLTFEPVASGDWDTGDRYHIKLSTALAATASSSSLTDLWAPEYFERRQEMDQTQAQAYSDALMTLYEQAVLQQAFVITAPHIKRRGARSALWRPFFEGGGYFRFDDYEDRGGVFNTSSDQQQNFLAVAMDYNYTRNRLRIVPGSQDSRLDAILNRARLADGQVIDTSGGDDHKGHHGGGSGGSGDVGPDGFARFPLPPWVIEYRRTGSVPGGFKL